jgi:SPP1 gp7 family putative phage head morphogenesis protein
MGIIEQAIMRFGGLTAADLESNRVRRAAPPPEQKQIPSLLGGSSLDFGRVWLGGQLELDELTRWSAYAYSVYAYAAMQYRATKVSEPYLWVGVETDEGVEYLPDDPIQQVLEYPSPDFDMGYLRAMTSMYLDMDGEALWHLIRDAGGRIARIYPYAKEQFEVQSGLVAGTGEDRLFARFRVQHQGGAKLYGPEDVVYFREPSIELTGAVTSRLDAALRWANMGERVEVAVKEAFKRGVLPFAVFSHPDDYNPDVQTREANRETLESRYGGAENHGRPLMLYGGLKAQFANVDLSTLLPSDVLDRVEANVALAFGVRAEVLGFMVGLKNSPWSHMETARRITYEDTIEPYWRREEKALTRQLLSEADRAAYKCIKVDTSEIRALQDDEKLKAEISKMNSDIWTVGERRLYTGKDPFDDERDDEITVARRNPFAAVEEQAGAPGPMEAKTLESGHIEWLELDLTAKADEKNWVPVVAKLLKGQRRDIERAYREFVRREGTTVSDESLIQFLGAVSDYLDGPGKQKALAALLPLVRSTGMQASRRAIARVGLSFDVVMPGVEKYLSEVNQWLVKSMDETTASRMATVVQDAMADRSNFDEILDRIMQDPAFNEQRAQLVARTETTRISNGVRLETATVAERETGRVMRKRWISSRDERTRDTHRENDDGEYYPLDYVWPTGSSVPDEYNCRCVLTFRADDGGATVGAET